MRVNQFVAHATGLSRRGADAAVTEKRVLVNGSVATLGTSVKPEDDVRLDNRKLSLPSYRTIIFNKPAGYVTSRSRQGSAHTVYDALPQELHELKPVGRLDRDSSGLLLLTNDGALAHRMQHPSFGKWKVYQVGLNRALTDEDTQILQDGVELEDGLSVLTIKGSGRDIGVSLQEGRNRQIRRSFEALDYKVVRLHRTKFGPLELGDLEVGAYRDLDPGELS